MTRYNRGDVILVPFPFSDQTSALKHSKTLDYEPL